MEYLIGALGMALLLFTHYAAYKAGHQSRKPAQREVDEEQARRAQRLRQGFEQLMSYDVSKATGKKGVG